ncbi:type II restriction endonuclease [Candidatus Pollutiaquabacter sp.]|uniref:type II restriction endonuclease n=1 Tax=Candidatus Pollutiaquabacter sp. TaxID=3416354 RepID=UPI003CA5B462|nr:EcoRV family type II restriction endonuclease [Bacteroidota bacterium]
MTKEDFLKALQEEVLEYNKIIATEKGDWIVKGFIDIYRNIYTISIDTKVVSKVIEILLIPEFEKFAKKYNLKLILPAQQNFYPDLSFVCSETGNKFAVDIKSTFKDSKDKIKSMTLGAFTGYFRNRESTKNTTFPYQEYQCHLVLGVIYTQVAESANEKEVYSLDEIESIESVIKDFQFFVQPKYKIAAASPGSGNTKNIGAVNNLEKLINGQGVFSELGEEVYDDYWTFYLTNDMAKALEIKRPYINLKTYLEYKSKGIDTLREHKAEILEMNEEEINEDLEGDEE